MLKRFLPFRRLSRRQGCLFLTLTMLAWTLISTLTAGIPSSPSLSSYNSKISHLHLSDTLTNSRLNPFRQPSHPPPRHSSDTFGGSSWWSDWKWLSVPFSSSLTNDDRALLPPLAERTPIYCYYDATIKRLREEKDAESDILLTWRRAWWAAGFRPVILSAAEAMDNPIYQEFQRAEIDPALKADLMRWMAWETMGGGLLAQYTLMPMIDQEDPLLLFLRRGDFPRLTRWEELGQGLFAGQPPDINLAIRNMMDPSILVQSHSVLSGMPEGIFDVDVTSNPLAYYSPDMIARKYSKIANIAKERRADGLIALNKLMNAHLHIAWQNCFPEGIEVLKPHPNHMTAMVAQAVALAQALASCPDNPMPSSCPPNMPDCTPCVAMTPMEVKMQDHFHNLTGIFTIGTVPHPWTFAVVDNLKGSLNVSWIRGEAPRDPWVEAVTQALLEGEVSSSLRIVHFKDSVASPHATSHTLWYTSEENMPADMDWHFGFKVPVEIVDLSHFETLTQGGSPIADKEEIAVEVSLLEQAKSIVGGKKTTKESKTRAVLEAWCMADTEAWKFTRAFQARRTMERQNWEAAERKYSSGAGSERGRTALNRWSDEPEKVVP